MLHTKTPANHKTRKRQVKVLKTSVCHIGFSSVYAKHLEVRKSHTHTNLAQEKMLKKHSITGCCTLPVWHWPLHCNCLMLFQNHLITVVPSKRQRINNKKSVRELWSKFNIVEKTCEKNAWNTECLFHFTCLLYLYHIALTERMNFIHLNVIFLSWSIYEDGVKSNEKTNNIDY